MELEPLLKQLHSIHPDPEYAKKSRGFILQTTPLPLRPTTRLMGWLSESIQFGSAIALTGLLLVVLAGGLSVVFKYLTQFNKLASLNPEGIHAEAQAVDMQLQLTSINYDESSPTAAVTKGTSAKKIPAAAVARKLSVITQQSDSDTLQGVLNDLETATQTQESVGIDQALDDLSAR